MSEDWADFASIRPTQASAPSTTTATAEASSGGDFWAADFVSASNSSTQAPTITKDSFGDDWGSFDGTSNAPTSGNSPPSASEQAQSQPFDTPADTKPDATVGLGENTQQDSTMPTQPSVAVTQPALDVDFGFSSPAHISSQPPPANVDALDFFSTATGHTSTTPQNIPDPFGSFELAASVDSAAVHTPDTHKADSTMEKAKESSADPFGSFELPASNSSNKQQSNLTASSHSLDDLVAQPTAAMPAPSPMPEAPQQTEAVGSGAASTNNTEFFADFPSSATKPASSSAVDESASPFGISLGVNPEFVDIDSKSATSFGEPSTEPEPAPFQEEEPSSVVETGVPQTDVGLHDSSQVSDFVDQGVPIVSESPVPAPAASDNLVFGDFEAPLEPSVITPVDEPIEQAAPVVEATPVVPPTYSEMKDNINLPEPSLEPHVDRHDEVAQLNPIVNPVEATTSAALAASGGDFPSFAEPNLQVETTNEPPSDEVAKGSFGEFGLAPSGAPSSADAFAFGEPVAQLVESTISPQVDMFDSFATPSTPTAPALMNAFGDVSVDTPSTPAPSTTSLDQNIHFGEFPVASSTVADPTLAVLSSLASPAPSSTNTDLFAGFEHVGVHPQPVSATSVEDAPVPSEPAASVLDGFGDFGSFSATVSPPILRHDVASSIDDLPAQTQPSSDVSTMSSEPMFDDAEIVSATAATAPSEGPAVTSSSSSAFDSFEAFGAAASSTMPTLTMMSADAFGDFAAPVVTSDADSNKSAEAVHVPSPPGFEEFGAPSSSTSPAAVKVLQQDEPVSTHVVSEESAASAPAFPAALDGFEEFGPASSAMSPPFMRSEMADSFEGFPALKASNANSSTPPETVSAPSSSVLDGVEDFGPAISSMSPQVKTSNFASEEQTADPKSSKEQQELVANTPPAPQLDGFEEFGTASSTVSPPTMRSEVADSFEDFSAPKATAPVSEPSADEFSDFTAPAAPSSTSNTTNDDDFGDFADFKSASATPAAPSGDDDFGDFTDFAAAPATASSASDADFADFASATSTSSDADFAQFASAPAPMNAAPPVQTTAAAAGPSDIFTSPDALYKYVDSYFKPIRQKLLGEVGLTEESLNERALAYRNQFKEACKVRPIGTMQDLPAPTFTKFEGSDLEKLMYDAAGLEVPDRAKQQQQSLSGVDIFSLTAQAQNQPPRVHRGIRRAGGTMKRTGSQTFKFAPDVEDSMAKLDSSTSSSLKSSLSGSGTSSKSSTPDMTPPTPSKRIKSATNDLTGDLTGSAEISRASSNPNDLSTIFGFANSPKKSPSATGLATVPQPSAASLSPVVIPVNAGNATPPAAPVVIEDDFLLGAFGGASNAMAAPATPAIGATHASARSESRPSISQSKYDITAQDVLGRVPDLSFLHCNVLMPASIARDWSLTPAEKIARAEAHAAKAASSKK